MSYELSYGSYKLQSAGLRPAVTDVSPLWEGKCPKAKGTKQSLPDCRQFAK